MEIDHFTHVRMSTGLDTTSKIAFGLYLTSAGTISSVMISIGVLEWGACTYS